MVQEIKTAIVSELTCQIILGLFSNPHYLKEHCQLASQSFVQWFAFITGALFNPPNGLVNKR